MSLLLHAKSVSHSLGDKRLFRDLDLAISAGDRLALVGHNGSGKSTLLSLLGGSAMPDSGEIAKKRGLVLASVEQFLPPYLEPKSVVAAVAELAPEQERWRAEALLAQLGFSEVEFALLVGELSGGEQNRLMFARALVVEPDLLLLDEPTNHLDLATLVLFEKILKEFRGGFLLVSHDRAFLDGVSQQTLFLRDEKLHRFGCTYSHARVELLAMDEADARTRASEERKIDALKVSAKRLATWGKVYDNEDFARRAKSMEKRIGRLEEKKTFVTKGSGLDLDLKLGDTRAKQIVAMENLTIDIASRELFRIDDLVIRPGERVALLGHNGVGKTTFIKELVTAFTREESDYRYSPQTSLGYYDQELDEVSGVDTMLMFVRNRIQSDEQRIRQHLIKAGFPSSEHQKRVSRMSGGERARLLFVVLAMLRPNFLVMDEPTNHIDIDGKEQLEQQLLSSDATLLITSHDRRFLETVANRYLWINEGRLEEIHDPQLFFTSEPVGGYTGSLGESGSQHVTEVRDAEQILERIVELEDLLLADRTRKIKFQKPKLQAEWASELEVLNSQLER
ncbi:MAG: ABC-F family ATP-binding cassette domain-containing protein [Gammaproteobacteria bacterium]|nr:ABC-F family ATP-binding cassette domain-containing protein [Gammaproteobacteria bacterium]